MLCGSWPLIAAGAPDPALTVGPGTYAWAFIQGVLVDFTPCVYPLIPITVSIFGASKDVPRSKALALASLYVLGMAVLYTSLGVVVALSGAGFGTWLGDARVVIPIVGLMIALSASMFGGYDLQLPVSWQTRLHSVGGAGPLAAFTMGLVSGLISAPCTGPVLLSLLAYIAHSSANGAGIAVGASLLFTYALGMGTLFFAVALGASLFRPGAWMEYVKSAFGIAMLVMAFWFLRPLSGDVRTLGTTAIWMPIVGAAAVLGGIALGAVHLSFKHGRSEALRKGAGVALATCGAALVMNAVLHVELKGEWREAQTVDEVVAILAEPSAADRPVLVDFGAEWCTPCKEIEHRVFADEGVARFLAGYTLIKIDVTAPSDEQAAMQRALGAETLPSVVVFRDPQVLRDDVDGLRAGKLAQPPDVHISSVPTVPEFLEALAGAEGGG